MLPLSSLFFERQVLYVSFVLLRRMADTHEIDSETRGRARAVIKPASLSMAQVARWEFQLSFGRRGIRYEIPLIHRQTVLCEGNRI